MHRLNILGVLKKTFYDIYIIKQIFVYMFPRVSQTAGPKGLNFFVGAIEALRKIFYFFRWQFRALELVIYIYLILVQFYNFSTIFKIFPLDGCPYDSASILQIT